MPRHFIILFDEFPINSSDVKKGENKENLVNKKYVSTGLSYDENTMVTDGLTKGDLVIVKGYHLVSAGVPVNLVK